MMEATPAAPQPLGVAVQRFHSRLRDRSTLVQVLRRCIGALARAGRPCIGLVAFTGAAMPAAAQVSAPAQYREPPEIIRDILDTRPTPAVMVAPSGRTLVLLGRPGMPDIAELAEPELRLAGLRINPRSNGPSRSGHLDALTFHDIESGERRHVTLPADARVAFPQWSPDGARLAFTNAVDNGIELWIADVRTGRARRLMGPVLNAALGSPCEWLPDGSGLLVRRVPFDRDPPPEPMRVPAGPSIRQNERGREVAVRTLPDLLSSPRDERLFEYYFTSQLVRQPVDGGPAVPVGDPGIIASFRVAPGGSHVLLTRVQRPYSYAVNVWSFGSVTEVMDMRGTRVHVVHDRTEIAVPPIGRDMVSAAPRSIHWRSDAPATLVWVEAADGGDAKQNAAIRDRVLLLDAPFTDAPRMLIELPGRYGGIQWGSANIALVHSRWSTTARVRTYVIHPSLADPSLVDPSLVDPSLADPPRAAAADSSRNSAEPRLLWDRSMGDHYGDPGRPVMRTNAAGYPVLRLSSAADAFYLTGAGASPEGSHPFVDRVDIATGATQRLWQAADPYHETLVAMLDDDAHRIITRRESQRDPPNYFVRDLVTGELHAMTHFADPAPQMAGMQRRLIRYERADGVPLAATLFTPAGYDAGRDGPLPMLMWAYPREYRDTASAGQVSGSTNRFSRPSGFSPLFLLTQGYAVLDGPAMPIIGGAGVEPNDTYVEQLVASARAAVDRVVALGVADPDRIAIAGHSYGAFMTANLLAHTDLFAAGMALSGAYNRTLTPFGFQSERRSYWDAKDVYDRMSAFNYADRINEPLLLIHGAADPNPGTFPLQTERMYQALAGHGATVRFVSLPHEGHSYVARESVMHVISEIIDWMERHVVN